jgi:titin
MFVLRIFSAACIAACTSTAMTISLSAAAAQASGTLPVTSVSSRFIEVTNLNNSGPGSFRAAITEVNTTSPGRLTVISFAVHGTITLASQLPAISRKVTIDATAAPTHVSGGPPVVEIGRAHDNRVFSSFIGTVILGLAGLGNQKGGVLIGGTAHGNVIGTFVSRPSDLISGNTGNGMTLLTGTHDNRVINNFGLDRIGRPLRNTGVAVVNMGTRNTFHGNRVR